MATDMQEKYSEWIGKARDYAVLGDNALILLGDSLEILLGTSLAADAVITDPPYEFDASGGRNLFGRGEKNAFNEMRDRGLDKGFDMRILEAAALAPSMAVFFHNDQLLKMLGTLTAPRRELVPYDEENGHYAPIWHEPFYSRFALCGWNKSNPLPVANKHYVPDTELYIHAWRAPAFPQGSIHDKARFITDAVGKSEYDHPTVKPQRVMRKVVTNASSQNEIILDPFMGSGSTGEAALMLGRRFIGIEIDKDFFEVSKNRLAGVAGEWLPSQSAQPTLFGD